MEYDGTPIGMLQDLFTATLKRRALLCPILELAKQGYTYLWGYPLAVAFRKDTSSFTLHTPAELPKLFSFLVTEPITGLAFVSSTLHRKTGPLYIPRPATCSTAKIQEKVLCTLCRRIT